MSAIVNVRDLPRFTVGTSLAGAAATAVLSGEDKTVAEVMGINLANTTGAAIVCTVEHYDGATARRVRQVSVAANGDEWIERSLAVKPGEELRVTGGAGVHVLVTVKKTVGNLG